MSVPLALSTLASSGALGKAKQALELTETGAGRGVSGGGRGDVRRLLQGPRLAQARPPSSGESTLHPSPTI